MDATTQKTWWPEGPVGSGGGCSGGEVDTRSENAPAEVGASVSTAAPSAVAGVPPVEAAVATSTRIRSHGSIDGGCRSNSAVRLRRNWALQGDRNARQVPRVLRQALPLRRTDAPSQPSGVHGCPRCQGGFCGRTQGMHRVPWGTACEGSAGANQPKTICSLEGHTVTVNRKKKRPSLRHLA